MQKKYWAMLLAAGIFMLGSCKNKAANESSFKESSPGVGAATVTKNAPSRQVIKTAALELQVENVHEEVAQLQQLIQSLNGHVYHYEMKSNREFINEHEVSLDSTRYTYRLQPIAELKVRIPASHGDTFIHAMLKNNAAIEHLLLDENDITDQLVLNETLNESNSTLTKDPDVDQLQIQNQLAHRKVNNQSLQYKSAYLWFDIQLQGRAQNISHLLATTHEYHTPIGIRLFHALDGGWQILANLVSACLYIWPIWIVGVILGFIWRKNYFKLRRSHL
jgi:hypothetical protein